MARSLNTESLPGHYLNWDSVTSRASRIKASTNQASHSQYSSNAGVSWSMFGRLRARGTGFIGYWTSGDGFVGTNRMGAHCALIRQLSESTYLQDLRVHCTTLHDSYRPPYMHMVERANCSSVTCLCGDSWHCAHRCVRVPACQ